MTLPEVLTMMFIAGLAIAFVRRMADLSRLWTYVDAALDAELARGEPAQAPSPPGLVISECEICGNPVPHRISVSVQTDDERQHVWLCPACMADDHEYERRLGSRHEEGRD